MGPERQWHKVVSSVKEPEVCYWRNIPVCLVPLLKGNRACVCFLKIYKGSDRQVLSVLPLVL